MNFTQKLAAIWQNINVVQRAMLIAAVVGDHSYRRRCRLLAQLPDMKVLYSGLDPEEAGKITDKISERNIAYKLNNAGTTVYVPKEHVTQLRLDMAKEGLPVPARRATVFSMMKRSASAPLYKTSILNVPCRTNWPKVSR